MVKSDLKYNKIKDKPKFKGNSKLEDPLLALKAKIEELKAAATVTKTNMLIQEK